MIHGLSRAQLGQLQSVLKDQLEEFFHSGEHSSYEEFLQKSSSLRRQLERVNRTLSLTQEPQMSPLPTHGELFTFKEFIDACRSGAFIDTDGSGLYATEDKASDIAIYPSDVLSGEVRSDFTHVVWFNC